MALVDDEASLCAIFDTLQLYFADIKIRHGFLDWKRVTADTLAVTACSSYKILLRLNPWNDGLVLAGVNVGVVLVPSSSLVSNVEKAIIGAPEIPAHACL